MTLVKKYCTDFGSTLAISLHQGCVVVYWKAPHQRALRLSGSAHIRMVQILMTLVSTVLVSSISLENSQATKQQLGGKASDVRTPNV